MPNTNAAGSVDLLMLENVCRYCRNYFFKPDRIYTGTFSIADNVITSDIGGKTVTLSDMVKPGQYYMIAGSDLNDGIHQSGRADDTLDDETFYGSVLPLSIPKAFLSLVSEIADWQTKNGDKVTSIYSSESFGGYSYTKASGLSSESGAASWQNAFQGRLVQWRKI